MSGAMERTGMAMGGEYGDFGEDAERKEHKGGFGPLSAVSWVIAGIPVWIWGAMFGSAYVVSVVFYPLDSRISTAIALFGCIFMILVIVHQRRRRQRGAAVRPLQSAIEGARAVRSNVGIPRF